MIITRTRLRISIGGGGTDLPSHHRWFGGFVISAATDKHAYAGLRDFEHYLASGAAHDTAPLLT